MQHYQCFEKTKRRYTCLGIVIFLSSLSIGLALTQMAFGNQHIRISKYDNGKEITLPRGSIVEVSLESQGATGYAWTFTKLDSSYVEILREKITGKANDGMTGGPVGHTWFLRLIKEGQTDIRMAYSRPWEGKDKSMGTFTINFRILP